MEAERKKASRWYRWLWLSPFLTIPTLVFIFIVSIENIYSLVCDQGLCNWALSEKLALLLAVALSSLWHLLLLIPVSGKSRLFVRWHGLQALGLAGLRTAVPFAIVLFLGLEERALLAIAALILIWFFGTFIAQQEAACGRCSLAQAAGHGDELARFRDKPVESDPEQEPNDPDTVRQWVNVIRYGDDPEQRRQALAALQTLNMVEDF